MLILEVFNYKDGELYNEVNEISQVTYGLHTPMSDLVSNNSNDVGYERVLSLTEAGPSSYVVTVLLLSGEKSMN